MREDADLLPHCEAFGWGTQGTCAGVSETSAQTATLQPSAAQPAHAIKSSAPLHTSHTVCISSARPRDERCNGVLLK